VAEVDRNRLLAAILDEFGDLLDPWHRAGGDVDLCGLRPGYLAVCATIGMTVSIELPGGRVVTGTAVDVDQEGAIVVDSGDGTRSRYSAGDVVHLRPSQAHG
jgi:BirA family biotin operon repressor/biotin-[acetyl-CoA-carboxylase] ligase